MATSKRKKTRTKSSKPNLTPKKGGPELQPDFSWHPVFLTTYAATGNVLASCKAAGITRPTFYDHLSKYHDFQLLVDVAKEEAIDELEKAARERGLASSDTLIIFLLKSLRPDVYRETIKNQHSGTVSVDVSQLSDDELRKLAQS